MAGFVLRWYHSVWSDRGCSSMQQQHQQLQHDERWKYLVFDQQRSVNTNVCDGNIAFVCYVRSKTFLCFCLVSYYPMEEEML